MKDNNSVVHSLLAGGWNIEEDIEEIIEEYELTEEEAEEIITEYERIKED